MLLLTVFLLILLAIISYRLFDFDIFAPPTVVVLGLLFSALCAFYNSERWDIDFSGETLWIIFVGVGMFILGGIVAVILSNMRTFDRFGFSHQAITVRPVMIENYKTIMILFVQVFTAVYLLYELRRMTGGAVWREIVTAYRLGTGRLADVTDDSFYLPFILRQLLEFNFAFVLIYAYVIGTNIAVKVKNPIWNWLSLIMGTMITLMRGYRSDMLRFWIALLIVVYVQRKRITGWSQGKEAKKMIKRMGLSLLFIAVLFVVLQGTVGRKDNDWDPLYYLTFYAGSPVAALDLFIKDPFPPSEIWGKESFYDLNQSIRLFFNKPELKYIFYKEFRKSRNGIYIGNIYTGLRAPYYDFGFKGLVIYMFVFGLFFTWLYLRLRKKRTKSVIDMDLVLYSYIAYTFFLYFYSTYNNFIAYSFLKRIIEILIIRVFLLGWRVKKRPSLTSKSQSFST